MKALGIAVAGLAILLPLHSAEPLTENAKSRWNTLKMNLVESAEAMPESDYSFKLTPAQRTFGEWIDHTVMSAFNNCAQMRGEAAPPMDHSAHSGNKPKAELVKAMKAAAAFCDESFASMTDQKLLTEVTINGKKIYPVSPMLNVITGLNSHYGNLVGYMRMKGVVPPSTARTQKTSAAAK